MSTQEDAYEYSQPGIDDREWTGDDPKGDAFFIQHGYTRAGLARQIENSRQDALCRLLYYHPYLDLDSHIPYTMQIKIEKTDKQH